MSCKSKTLISLTSFHRPSYNRRSRLSTFSDTSTYLYWPSPYFHSEYKLQEKGTTEDREWIDVTKKTGGQSREATLLRKYGAYFLRKRSNKCPPLTWRIGVISDCYVGVCCTEETSIDDSPNELAEFQVS